MTLVDAFDNVSGGHRHSQAKYESSINGIMSLVKKLIVHQGHDVISCLSVKTMRTVPTNNLPTNHYLRHQEDKQTTGKLTNFIDKRRIEFFPI